MAMWITITETPVRDDVVDDYDCGSCGAMINLSLAEEGDLYHKPDEDCRAVREVQ